MACVVWDGLNRFVHEGMNHSSNVKVHLKTRSGNVNIWLSILVNQGVTHELSGISIQNEIKMKNIPITSKTGIENLYLIRM